ncbi:MAG: vitamin K epoxide reductase family protein [Patescibacteria group bacterium]
MELLPVVVIIFAAFGGFVLAAYLSHKKKAPEPMICPLKGDCKAVIRSEFSSFFGIGVEKLGMVYYLVIAVAYGALVAWPALATPTNVFLIVGLSAAAFLFSLYLTFIQIGFLRSICTWCLLSAILSTIIFFTSLAASDFIFTPWLVGWRTPILIVHLVGLAMGVGGALFADVFFFKFIRDLKISKDEAGILQTISQVVWFGLGLLVLSGVGLFLTDPAAYSQSAKFLTKMIVVAVVIVNGAFLNLKITPHLIHISFGDDPHKSPEEELQRERRIAFALGAISMVSWYSALILGAFPSLPFSLPTLLLTYALLLAAAVTGSQVMERYIGRKPMAAD